MPLTDADFIAIRMLLKLRPSRPNATGTNLANTMLSRRVAALSDAAIQAVQTILAEFNTVRFQSGELRGDYESSPERQRTLLRRHLITVLDFDPADYGVGGTDGFPAQMDRGS
jgi:hypothetical protein